MRIGVVFPQTEITADPDAVATYAKAVQDSGYTHILAYDHVVGADTRVRPDWQGPYTVESLFHEPLVLFGFLAAIAPQVELVTGIIIAPQRQTVLLAKQATEVDVLTRGRFRLGLGIGWNEVEYLALNENFRTRGKRLDEQIELLRALFSQRSVTFEGRWHRVDAAGLYPLPVRNSIPIWLGGHSESALRRVGRVADGWFPQTPPDDRTRDAIAIIHASAREAGRDPTTIGIEARLSISGVGKGRWRETVEAWKSLGATHLSVNTMNAGLTSPEEHVETITTFAGEVFGF